MLTYSFHFSQFNNLSVVSEKPKFGQFIPGIYNKIIIKILGYFWGITPPSAYDLPEVVAVLKNLVHQTPKDQFLHWRQEMERKQEEQARQMQELQARAERLQRENDQL